MDNSSSALPLIVLGAGGHAKVLLSLANELEREVLGVCAPEFDELSERAWRGIATFGNDAALDTFDASEVELVNGLGQLVGNNRRQQLHSAMKSKGYRFASLVHPSAWVDPSTKIGEGVQIMAGAVIQADCVIGDNVIVNTCTSIDHDCRIDSHVHVAPGVTVCGSVSISTNSFIGSGAIITPGVNVGAGAIVGAGAVVLRDVGSGERYIGRSF